MVRAIRNIRIAQASTPMLSDDCFMASESDVSAENPIAYIRPQREHSYHRSNASNERIAELQRRLAECEASETPLCCDAYAP